MTSILNDLTHKLLPQQWETAHDDDAHREAVGVRYGQNLSVPNVDEYGVEDKETLLNGRRKSIKVISSHNAEKEVLESPRRRSLCVTPATQSLPARVWSKVQTAFNIYANLLDVWSRPSNGTTYHSLDGLRAWAVLWVLAIHCILRLGTSVDPTYLQWKVITNGDLGVDIFFVLSGFLIGDILLREFESSKKVNFTRFLSRRWLRIFPAYIITIVLTIFLGSIDRVRQGCIQFWWTNLLLVNNFVGPLLIGDLPSGPLSCVSQTWSIAVEFQFYLLSPFIILLITYPFSCFQRERQRSIHEYLVETKTIEQYEHYFRCFLLCLIGSVPFIIQGCIFAQHSAAAQLPKWFYDDVYVKFYTRYFPYMVGMFVAYQHRYLKANMDNPKTLALYVNGVYFHDLEPASVRNLRWLTHTFFLALWGLVSYYGAGLQINLSDPSQFMSTWNVVLNFLARPALALSLGYFIYMMLTSRARLLRQILSSRFWLPFAKTSYSAYLLQFLWIDQIVIWFTGSDTLLQLPAAVFGVLYCIVSFAVTFLSAIVMYVFVERPLMQLR